MKRLLAPVLAPRFFRPCFTAVSTELESAHHFLFCGKKWFDSMELALLRAMFKDMRHFARQALKAC